MALELAHIKELMAAMNKHGAKRLEYRREGEELVLERECRETSYPVAPQVYHAPPAPTGHLPADRLGSALSHGGDIASMNTDDKRKKEKEGTFIESPIVGIFYSASSPDTPVFVKVGDRVEKNTVVGIVEAMKVMNEVKAGVSGVITEICLSNGEPVEVGTHLFRVTEGGS